MNLTFNEWLQSRDAELYNEISWQDIKNYGRTAKDMGIKAYPYMKKAYQGGKIAWDAVGKAIGPKARNLAMAGIVTVAGLASALAPDERIDLVSHSMNMPRASVVQLQNEEPATFQQYLDLAIQGKQFQDKLTAVNKSANDVSSMQDKIMNFTMPQAEPTDINQEINKILGKK